eukprot:1235881-Amorphochlora_amoeboformis.AAC.1
MDLPFQGASPSLQRRPRLFCTTKDQDGTLETLTLTHQLHPATYPMCGANKMTRAPGKRGSEVSSIS